MIVSQAKKRTMTDSWRTLGRVKVKPGRLAGQIASEASLEAVKCKFFALFWRSEILRFVPIRSDVIRYVLIELTE